MLDSVQYGHLLVNFYSFRKFTISLSYAFCHSLAFDFPVPLFVSIRILSSRNFVSVLCFSLGYLLWRIMSFLYSRAVIPFIRDYKLVISVVHSSPSYFPNKDRGSPKIFSMKVLSGAFFGWSSKLSPLVSTAEVSRVKKKQSMKKSHLVYRSKRRREK